MQQPPPSRHPVLILRRGAVSDPPVFLFLRHPGVPGRDPAPCSTPPLPSHPWQPARLNAPNLPIPIPPRAAVPDPPVFLPRHPGVKPALSLPNGAGTQQHPTTRPHPASLVSLSNHTPGNPRPQRSKPLRSRPRPLLRTGRFQTGLLRAPNHHTPPSVSGEPVEPHPQQPTPTKCSRLPTPPLTPSPFPALS